MKKLLTILIIFSAFGANAQTLTTAQLTARVKTLDSLITLANGHIKTLYAQNDSYKKQLTEAQATITKLVVDTASQAKRIAALEARQIIVGSGLRMSGDTLIATATTPTGFVTTADFSSYTTAALTESKALSNRISVLEDWRKQFANWIKLYNQ